MDQIPALVQKMYNLAAILATLNGFRFYGCSLLLIYDGDQDVQTHYARQMRSRRPTHERAESVFTSATPRRRQSLAGSRRSRSADVSDPTRFPPQKVRGELVVRIVDFAHTTTGQDIVYPYPPDVVDPPDMGKGYLTLEDKATGRPLARFPPHHPEGPDLGFIFGICSIVASLRSIYASEMERRRANGQPAPALPSFENADVFDKLFPPDFDNGYLST